MVVGSVGGFQEVVVMLGVGGRGGRLVAGGHSPTSVVMGGSIKKRLDRGCRC